MAGELGCTACTSATRGSAAAVAVVASTWALANRVGRAGAVRTGRRVSSRCWTLNPDPQPIRCCLANSMLFDGF